MNNRTGLLLFGIFLASISAALSQPAVIQFSSASYSVSETGSLATITVEITWGDFFDVYSVDYATSDDTATAGLDYVVQGGTLSFEWPETKKVFTVPIIDDALWEGDETLVLTLSKPHEQDFEFGDAMLGSVSNAVLTIEANDNP